MRQEDTEVEEGSEDANKYYSKPNRAHLMKCYNKHFMRLSFNTRGTEFTRKRLCFSLTEKVSPTQGIKQKSLFPERTVPGNKLFIGAMYY